MEVVPIDTRDAGQIERGVTAFARSPNGGLIIMPGASASAMAMGSLSRMRRGAAAIAPFNAVQAVLANYS